MPTIIERPLPTWRVKDATPDLSPLLIRAATKGEARGLLREHLGKPLPKGLALERMQPLSCDRACQCPDTALVDADTE